MPFSYRELFCGGRTFCCCLPVRMGVIVMSLLGIIVAGILSIILWFEIASTADMTSGERAAFVIAALVETFLFVASALGFVGTVVRKQLFVQIYAYFIYVHFVLNIGVASYLLYLVTHFSANATVKACQDTIQNEQAQEQCTGLLKVAQGVYFAIAAIVLLVELYLVLVVTRYLNQLHREKRSARGLRLENEEAFSLVPKDKGRYSALAGEQDGGIIPRFPVYSRSGPDFDPYDGVQDFIQDERRTIGNGDTVHPEEIGYGGGSWTHAEISSEEKARLKLMDHETDGVSGLKSGDTAHWNPESKARTGPTSEALNTADLPRYTLSDGPSTLDS